jgi:hypothetical protein
VKESPVQLECKVNQVIELGQGGGAGNLVICEIILLHINEEVLDANKMIDQKKIDLVARMGGNWYCRAHGDALFEIEKPITTLGIGIDQLPDSIRKSKVFTGNDLGKLGNVEHLPGPDEIAAYKSNGKKYQSTDELHKFAKALLEQENVKEAWLALLTNES